MRNGAKGISDFIVYFLPAKPIKNKPTIDPKQKDKIKEKIPEDKPSNQPIPRINLPSPIPISLPFEK